MEQQELWQLRAFIQRYGWERIFMELGSIAAEQADKVPKDSEQDKAMFSISCLVHSAPFLERAKHMGFFDYRPFIELGWIPTEHHAVLRAAEPVSH